MPKKIRVYELARELGLTNKEALDLCVMLGIGVKSHSSSIEDAQADRARRRADADGLRRPVSPEEPAKETTEAKDAGPLPTPAAPAAPAAGGGAEPPSPPEPRPEGDVPAPGTGRDPRLIVSRPTPPPEVVEPRPQPAVRPAPAPMPAPSPFTPAPRYSPSRCARAVRFRSGRSSGR